VHPDEDVLLGGHVLEEPDVLERPTDPGLDHVVGSGAPEHAETDQQPLVPLGPGDRRDQHDDQEGQADQATDDAQRPVAQRVGQQERDDPTDQRRGDPKDGLEPATNGPGDHPPTLEVDVAGGRVVDAGHDVEEGRLAGAVGPDQRHDRAFRDVEVDGVDGDEAAEPLRHGARRQDDAARHLDLERAEFGRRVRQGLLRKLDDRLGQGGLDRVRVGSHDLWRRRGGVGARAVGPTGLDHTASSMCSGLAPRESSPWSSSATWSSRRRR
jgi:hypothetical protein